MGTSVVIADDHALVREGLRTLIESRLPDVKVVGEACTGAETLALCREMKPAVLVLDISMPDLGGLDVLSRLRDASPDTQVVIVSQYSDRPYVLQALRLGARAYVPKKAAAKDLIGAIQAMVEGRAYIDPTVAGLVLDAVAHPSSVAEPPELGQLTRREREVLQLIAEGKTAREVGAILGISPFTVNRHRANMMEKLHLHGKVDLVRLAARLKMIDA